MSAVSLGAVCQSLVEIAPLKLAESWDNVGLLAGDRASVVNRVMTCLTITPSVVDEALARQADLVVAHHPMPFRPVKKVTSDSLVGQMLWQLIGGQVAVYSAHTAFDSAAAGVNQCWADSLELNDVGPIVMPTEDRSVKASGRLGQLSTPASSQEILQRCAETAGAGLIRAVGDLNRKIQKVGFACGSGGSFVSAAHRRGCELLVTGEATFHDCLEAESLGMTLGLLGHYQSERFAMEILAARLTKLFPGLSVWASEQESDPISVVLPQ